MMVAITFRLQLAQRGMRLWLLPEVQRFSPNRPHYERPMPQPIQSSIRWLLIMIQVILQQWALAPECLSLENPVQPLLNPCFYKMYIGPKLPTPPEKRVLIFVYLIPHLD